MVRLGSFHPRKLGISERTLEQWEQGRAKPNPWVATLALLMRSGGEKDAQKTTVKGELPRIPWGHRDVVTFLDLRGHTFHLFRALARVQ
jgi:transcriptional regulator with XRE-family HTH domain